MNPKPNYLCIDASNLLHRYFHGMPPLLSQKAGIHTHALTAWVNFFVGMTSRMNFLPANTQPVVFFDSKRDLVAEGIVTHDPTQAIEGSITLDYKGTRKAKDPSLKIQLQLAVEITRLMGILHVKTKGHEADTLLGSFVLNEQNNAESIYVLSTDKDMLQLVGDNILCIHPQKGGGYKIMDDMAVLEKMGVRPTQIADLLVMMGDTVDNIPGIPGVGSKTAQKLLNEYGTLAKILENADKIKGTLGEKIRKHAPMVPAIRQLVTFKKADVPMVQNPRETEELRELLTELEMFRTLANLGLSRPQIP